MSSPLSLLGLLVWTNARLMAAWLWAVCHFQARVAAIAGIPPPSPKWGRVNSSANDWLDQQVASTPGRLLSSCP